MDFLADITPLLPFLWLFLLAFIAGVIDSMAGGGGLLTVPGLLTAGLDPLAALATNKFQGVFGPLSASLHLWRKGKIDVKRLALPAALAFLGAVAGAATLSFIKPDTLKALIPFLLISIALYVLFSPKLGAVKKAPRLSSIAFALTLVPFVGFYDGFIGPGTGSFFALGGVALLGLTLDEATMQAKLYNFMSNLGGLLFFLASGHVVFSYGLVMAVGMALGGNIGARLILRHGTALVKPLLVIMSLGMSIKLLWQGGFFSKVLP